ncbi:MAG: tRNA preQ1(34) S-adenosylmethionine ribosyltransferase-isomerase QueA [Gammaproteobacteria bacterium]|nr:tRNA preQ1(34) S-adenosylmethionine ribosyltransferase-isomerase QueA [Gammaproteobacteria bacterium]
MNLVQFDYELPEALIAQSPLDERTSGRLLHFACHGSEYRDLKFLDLKHLLREGDLLVLNDTRVIPARLFCRKSSGGKVELLIERILDAGKVIVHLKASKPPAPGSHLVFANDVVAKVKGRRDDLFVLQFKDQGEIEMLLQQFGKTPLPPYISREPDSGDRERYQTVFARHPGAVAAPTAGLHFDQPLLEQLQQQGVEHAFITLHVGAGTFQPVRTQSIEAHRLHAEQAQVTQQVCQKVLACKRRGGRVIAVGTTAVRALESAAQEGSLRSYSGDTSLFIFPGFQFRVVDGLVTNFHLPKSTLLMLVCAFAGYETTMAAYRHAVTQRYRFYSYGDAMFIEPGE